MDELQEHSLRSQFVIQIKTIHFVKHYVTF